MIPGYFILHFFTSDGEHFPVFFTHFVSFESDLVIIIVESQVVLINSYLRVFQGYPPWIIHLLIFICVSAVFIIFMWCQLYLLVLIIIGLKFYVVKSIDFFLYVLIYGYILRKFLPILSVQQILIYKFKCLYLCHVFCLFGICLRIW